jgi:hypothetical protein
MPMEAFVFIFDGLYDVCADFADLLGVAYGEVDLGTNTAKCPTEPERTIRAPSIGLDSENSIAF